MDMDINNGDLPGLSDQEETPACDRKLVIDEGGVGPSHHGNRQPTETNQCSSTEPESAGFDVHHSSWLESWEGQEDQTASSTSSSEKKNNDKSNGLAEDSLSRDRSPSTQKETDCQTTKTRNEKASAELQDPPIIEIYLPDPKNASRKILHYECVYCSKHFHKRYLLKRHFPVHTGQRQHICPFCGESFTSSSTLSRHKVVHREIRLHQCPDCGKSFNRMSTLAAHRATHSQQKKFTCDVCQKGFHQKGNLKNHMFTHSKERPFCCELCDMSFSQRTNLTVHMKRNHRDVSVQYKCRQCSASFTLRKELRTHQLELHYNTIQETLASSSAAKTCSATEEVVTMHLKDDDRSSVSTQKTGQDSGPEMKETACNTLHCELGKTQASSLETTQATGETNQSTPVTSTRHRPNILSRKKPASRKAAQLPKQSAADVSKVRALLCAPEIKQSSSCGKTPDLPKPVYLGPIESEGTRRVSVIAVPVTSQPTRMTTTSASVMVSSSSSSASTVTSQTVDTSTRMSPSKQGNLQQNLTMQSSPTSSARDTASVQIAVKGSRTWLVRPEHKSDPPPGSPLQPSSPNNVADSKTSESETDTPSKSSSQVLLAVKGSHTYLLRQQPKSADLQGSTFQPTPDISTKFTGTVNNSEMDSPSVNSSAAVQSQILSAKASQSSAISAHGTSKPQLAAKRNKIWLVKPKRKSDTQNPSLQTAPRSLHQPDATSSDTCSIADMPSKAPSDVPTKAVVSSTPKSGSISSLSWAHTSHKRQPQQDPDQIQDCSDLNDLNLDPASFATSFLETAQQALDVFNQHSSESSPHSDMPTGSSQSLVACKETQQNRTSFGFEDQPRYDRLPSSLDTHVLNKDQGMFLKFTSFVNTSEKQPSAEAVFKKPRGKKPKNHVSPVASQGSLHPLPVPSTSSSTDAGVVATEQIPSAPIVPQAVIPQPSTQLAHEVDMTPLGGVPDAGLQVPGSVSSIWTVSQPQDTVATPQLVTTLTSVAGGAGAAQPQPDSIQALPVKFPVHQTVPVLAEHPQPVINDTIAQPALPSSGQLVQLVSLQTLPNANQQATYVPVVIQTNPGAPWQELGNVNVVPQRDTASLMGQFHSLSQNIIVNTSQQLLTAGNAQLEQVVQAVDVSTVAVTPAPQVQGPEVLDAALVENPLIPQPASGLAAGLDSTEAIQATDNFAVIMEKLKLLNQC